MSASTYLAVCVSVLSVRECHGGCLKPTWLPNFSCNKTGTCRCSDNYDFKDRYGNDCKTWNADCIGASKVWPLNYTQKDERHVIRNCPLSCAICECGKQGLGIFSCKVEYDYTTEFSEDYALVPLTIWFLATCFYINYLCRRSRCRRQIQDDDGCASVFWFDQDDNECLAERDDPDVKDPVAVRDDQDVTHGAVGDDNEGITARSHQAGPHRCFTGWSPFAHGVFNCGSSAEEVPQDQHVHSESNERSNADQTPSEEDATLQTSAEERATLQKIAARGFTLGSLLELLCLLCDPKRALSEIKGLSDAYKQYADLGQLEDFPDFSWFNPSQSETWEVAYRAIVPLSRNRCTSLSTILTGYQKCFPRCIVSHTWGNVFTHTVAAFVADALGVSFYVHIVPQLVTFDRVRALMHKLGATRLSKTYWFCAVSVNQHTIGCHTSPWPCTCSTPKCCSGPESEIGAFDKMMTILEEKHNSDLTQASSGMTARSQASLGKSSFYQLVAIDMNVTVVERVWVVAEIAEAHILQLKQVLKPYFPLPLSGRLRDKIGTIDVNKCQSTMPEDKDFILGKIGDQTKRKRYNELVKEALSVVPTDRRFFWGWMCSLPLFAALTTQQLMWAIQESEIHLLAKRRFFHGEDMFRDGEAVHRIVLLLILSMVYCVLACSTPIYIFYWMVAYRKVRSVHRKLSVDGGREEVAAITSTYMMPGHGPYGTVVFLWAPVWFRKAMIVVPLLPQALMVCHALFRVGDGKLGCSLVVYEASWYLFIFYLVCSTTILCMWLGLVASAYCRAASMRVRCLTVFVMIVFAMMCVFLSISACFSKAGLVFPVPHKVASVLMIVGFLTPLVLLYSLWARVEWISATNLKRAHTVGLDSIGEAEAKNVAVKV